MKRLGNRSQGIALIELIVGLAIIGILVSLTLMAIGATRESVRTTQCLDRLRQLTLACQNFEQQYRFMPHNGGPAPDSKLVSETGLEVVPATIDYATFETYEWGVGDPKRSGRDQTGSWLFSILPQIDAGTVALTDERDVNVTLFLCPSRGRGETVVAPVGDEYGDYRSAGMAMSKNDYCGNASIAVNRPRIVRLNSILDGHSNTILVGEKAIDPIVQVPTSWYWDEPFWLGGSKGTAREGIQIFRDRVGIVFKENWSSPHPAGVNFSWLDGSARTISISVDSELFASLMTIDAHD